MSKVGGITCHLLKGTHILMFNQLNITKERL